MNGLWRWAPFPRAPSTRHNLPFSDAGAVGTAHHHVAIVGPVGVGKSFLAHALGHIACRRGHSVLALRTDAMLKTLKHARLTQSHEAELRKLLAVDLLILDSCGVVSHVE